MEFIHYAIFLTIFVVLVIGLFIKNRNDYFNQLKSQIDVKIHKMDKRVDLSHDRRYSRSNKAVLILPGHTKDRESL